MFGTSYEAYVPKLIDFSINFAQSSLRVVLIVIAALLAIKFIRIGLSRLEAILVRARESSESVPGAAAMRIRTLMSVLWTIVAGLVWFTAVLTILGQVGVNVTPILASAGVVGLAVGFGAQNLVKDFVSGFFLILENQIRVGDVAVINGTGGLVEAITFRTIVLRDQAAVVHVFPNGSINTLSNMTKDWSAYVIDVGVSYREDTDRVVEVMRRVAGELQSDPQYGSAMLAPIEIIGVNAFTDSAVTIKARLKTLPIKQWMVGREYRRRLKKAFDAENIEFPFPQRTVLVGEAKAPLPLGIKPSEGN
ncbi:MAG TPA: mechanosensitive ion channel family protein [Candidatus Binatia bacterium]|jgi:moderate conductance mechanosensitive channel